MDCVWIASLMVHAVAGQNVPNEKQHTSTCSQKATASVLCTLDKLRTAACNSDVLTWVLHAVYEAVTQPNCTYLEQVQHHTHVGMFHPPVDGCAALVSTHDWYFMCPKKS